MRQAVQLHCCSGVCKTKGLWFTLSSWVQLVSVPAPVPSYKVGSTLTMPLPMQGSCNFIVDIYILLWASSYFVSFHFFSSSDSSFYNLPIVFVSKSWDFLLWTMSSFFQTSSHMVYHQSVHLYRVKWQDSVSDFNIEIFKQHAWTCLLVDMLFDMLFSVKDVLLVQHEHIESTLLYFMSRLFS